MRGAADNGRDEDLRARPGLEDDELGLEISPRDEDTVGGVVLSELGQSPRVGDRVRLGPLTLEVLELKGNRVCTLLVEKQEEPPA